MTTQSTPPDRPAVPTPELVLQAGNSASITAIAFSPDGRHFATAEGDGQVVLWNCRDGSVANIWQRQNHSPWIGFPSPDHLVIHSDHGLELIHRSAVHSSQIPLPGRFLNALQASVGHVTLVDGEGTYRAAMTYGKPDDLAPQRCGPGVHGSLLALSADGGTLAFIETTAAGKRFENWLQVWDLHTGTVWLRKRVPATLVWWTRDPTGRRRKLRSIRDSLQLLALSPDGRTLAIGGHSTLWLCDARTGRLSHLLLRYDAPMTIVFSPEGELIAAGTMSGTVAIWNVASGEPILAGRGHGAGVTALAFSPDAQSLISGARDKTLTRWDLVNSTCEQVPLRTFDGTRASASDVRFSPDGSRIAVSDVEGAVRLWSARNGELELLLLRTPADVRELTFSPDGRLLFGRNCRLLYDFEKGIGEEAGEPEEAEQRPVVSPDCRWTARISKGGKIAIQDAATGELLWSIPDPDGEDDVSALVFSPDSRTLAAGYEGFRIRLWDVETGQCRQRIRSHEDANYHLAFSPDGRLLAIGGAYGKEVILCDLWRNTQPIRFALTEAERQYPEVVTETYGRPAEEIPAPEVSLLGHAGSIRGSCFSPDGRTVATGAEDAALKLWDPDTGRLRATMQPLPAADGSSPGEWITDTPDGYYIHSPSAAQWIRWRVGGKLLPVEAFASEYNAPDRVARVVRGLSG